MNSTQNSPQVSTVAHVGTMAGVTMYKVNVTYEGEATQPVRFSGYAGEENGLVIMVTNAVPGGTRVTAPERFGPFGPEWVKRFFA